MRGIIRTMRGEVNDQLRDCQIRRNSQSVSAIAHGWDAFFSRVAAPGGDAPIPGARIVNVKQEWWDGEGQIFLVWGILNPTGPTLYVLGSREFDGKQRIAACDRSGL
jgi:hypothetical protein